MQRNANDSLFSGHIIWGLPGSSACNIGDPSSIPGSGSSPSEGIGYPLQYSWASLMTRMVKNPPTTQESWVRSLCWKTSWRRTWQPIPVFLPGILVLEFSSWRIPTDRRAWWATVSGVAKSWTQLSD